MPTRLKRPSILKQLGLTAILLAFQGYLAFNAISGQYGLEGGRQIEAEMVRLRQDSARLQAEIDAYKHRISLFNAERLDPDILSERAVALLGMIHKNDRVLVLKDYEVTHNQVNDTNQLNVD